MLESLPFAILVGIVLGFLAGLGVGGGSLLILWLTLMLQLTQWEARVINLMFFIPASFISCVFRWKQGTLEIKTVLPAVIAGCLCAAVFSQIGKMIDQDAARKLFGILLLLTGIRELLYRPRKLR